MIDIEEAVYFLMTSRRDEVEDNNLGLVGCRWTRDGRPAGEGYFDHTGTGSVNVFIDGREQTFMGDEARRLRVLGVLATSVKGVLDQASPTVNAAQAEANEKSDQQT